MVINRVSYDGECNDDYLDYYRTEKILRQIEQQYDLIIQPSSWEVQKKKAYPKHIEQTEKSGEPNLVERLQNSIEQAAADQPAMPVFVARLLKENVQVDCKFTRTGKLKGISYCLDGQPFKGGDLGKLYTHTGIREHLQVSYIEDYRHPVESLIESFKRGRTIDDTRIGQIQAWVEWREHLTYKAQLGIETSNTTGDNQHHSVEVVTKPGLEEVAVASIKGDSSPVESTKLTIKGEETPSTPVVSIETSYLEEEITVSPVPTILPVPAESRTSSTNTSSGDSSEAPPTDSDNQLFQSQQRELLSAIAQTVLLLWSRQDLVKKSKKYDLHLGEDNIIYVSHKSGEIIASIPLDENQTPQGIALTKVDVDNFQKIQEILDTPQHILDARQQLQTKPSNLADGIEL